MAPRDSPAINDVHSEGFRKSKHCKDVLLSDQMNVHRDCAHFSQIVLTVVRSIAEGSKAAMPVELAEISSQNLLYRDFELNKG